ncbi:alpha-D-xyloside xylohydrolase [Kineothrix alysoides]|uniref:alpha-D-xyloside xylohydrolase n=1 Tax=Kineothrix alysoides TaxID=1469948 RepID=A0A4R1QV23_9FIRM|nr:alpha-xylosidase [Kineothrix alysoides]TCL56961.1 alpha-D-xyloside xylohydrolase [Kineothrix alysoides]
MKFTNGYWRIREEIEPVYAVEYYDCEVKDNKLTVYAATKHMVDRGDTLNQPMLTVTFSSPMEDVIKVSAVHFKGALNKGPNYEVNEQSGDFISISEEEEKIIYTSGKTSAVIYKAANAWKVEFKDGNRLLTESSYRNLAYMKNKETKQNYMAEQLLLDVGEYVYGMGERYTPFIKNGQVVEIWNEDGGTASEQTYKNIPFYVTNKGYGVFVAHAGDVHFEVGSEKVERVQFSVRTEQMEYYILNGHTPKGTVQLYTQLMGKPALPPSWSFGLWLTTSFTTNYDEKTTSSFIQGMADRDIPLHTFHFDCFWMKGYEWCNFEWDKDTFPDPEGMLRRYKERGLHICVWINSYIGQKSTLFDEGMEHGYFVKNVDGSVWQCDRWQAGMALVDFTNPQACKWYEDKLERLIDMGVDCFKTDFGERIPVTGVQYYDGSDTVKMHNYYSYLYNKVVFELLERKLGKDKALVFARSTAAGGQKYPVHWGGDCTATYPSMAEDLRGGLSLALGGYGFWSHDIGGFEQTASADVYKRWCAFGLLSSHSRLHGSTSYRVPWLFDEEACDILRKFVKLKCSLMPYIYAQAVKAHKEGIPMMRPMFLEFPEDLTCETLDKQYMLGDSLLVAPVFKETGEVSYYLPEGKWTNYLTGDVKEGGKWYKEVFDYFHLPLMVRENTVLAVGSNDERPDYDYTEGTTLKLFQIQDGAQVYTTVPDIAGKEAMKVSVSAKKEKISLSVLYSLQSEGDKHFFVEAVGHPEAEVTITENRAEIVL